MRPNPPEATAAMLAAALLLLPMAAPAQPATGTERAAPIAGQAPANGARRRAPAPAASLPPAALARDIDAALSRDAGARGLLAERDAVRARDALVRSPFPGAPSVGGSGRVDTRGWNTARELDLEVAAPVWLPGQRSALAGTVEAGVSEAERRFAARRLAVAGALRDAYWAVGEAESDRRVARDRLETARAVANDLNRRAAYGDISETEALLGRNEVLAAELDLVRAEAAVEAARTAYRTLTGGTQAALPALSSTSGGLAGVPAEAPSPVAEALPAHPAIVAAEAALEAAEARARLVAATPRDNPEIAVFGRTQEGPVTEQGTSFGLRMRLPLSVEARNAPRRAEAEADRTRATAELEQARRQLEGELRQARIALTAAESARRLAAERRGLADRQLAAARTAFASGEIGAFDLFRVRGLQVEATAEEARAAVALGRARSRLNQALGWAPEG